MEKLKSKLRKWWLAALLAPLFFVVLAWFAADFLITEKPLPQADVIFVLSGNTVWGERTNRAAELFHAGRASKIVLTNDGVQAGWQESLQRSPFYWEWERWNLIAKGVPEEAIEVLPSIVAGTQGEAEILAKNAKERGWRSVLLVTSPFHTRRALWAAERVCERQNAAVEIGVEPSESREKMSRWWTSPRNWLWVLKEYLKFVYYWFFY